MSNEINIKPVAAVTGGVQNPAEPPAGSSLLPAPASAPVTSASPMPNPQLRLDPALGLVVIEFRDASGTVTTSIPSQRQLNAYRMWGQVRLTPGELPGPSQVPSDTNQRRR